MIVAGGLPIAIVTMVHNIMNYSVFVYLPSFTVAGGLSVAAAGDKNIKIHLFPLSSFVKWYSNQSQCYYIVGVEGGVTIITIPECS